MILALRALGVGDLATAVPALRGLRAAHPTDTLALAVPRWLFPLAELIGGIDSLLPVKGLDEAAVDGLRPALAVNLHGSGPQSHRLLRRARPARLLGYACPAAGHDDGPAWRDGEHEVARWCRLLDWYGIGTDPGDLALHRPAGRHRAGVTILHPGAKSAQRRWPAHRFAAVARELALAGHRLVITGSVAEHDLAAGVARAAGLPAGAVLAGRTDVGALAGLVAHARLVISGDTGIAHLATAYSVPSVVLFGSMSPAAWGPPADRPWHRVLWHPDLAGRPWAAGGAHPALRAITVPDVLAAAGEALAAAPGGVDGMIRHAAAAK